MTLWKSDRVDLGTSEARAAKAEAAAHARNARVLYGAQFDGRARVEWRDEYNDNSARGVFAVVA